MPAIPRPDPQEFGDYLAYYLGLVPDGDILEILTRQRRELVELLDGLDEERGGHRYAEGKWSIRGVLGHLIDTERVFALRALWIARGERAPQPGMEQDAWAAVSNADRRRLADLLAEYRTVRESSLHLFRGLDAEAWARRGVANETEISVQALPHVLAGHERHHLDVLVERYL